MRFLKKKKKLFFRFIKITLELLSVFKLLLLGVLIISD